MFVSISFKNFFHCIIMVIFGVKEIAKETFYAGKKPIKTWDVNVDKYVIGIKFDQ